MSNLRFKITYLNEIHEILQRRHRQLKLIGSLSESDISTGKATADAMMKSARGHYYEIEGEINSLDKKDVEVRVIKRKMTSIKGYSRKIYKICGEYWYDR